MSKNDPIMQRMKENYEKPARKYLTKRTPVVIRLDGKAFGTYTKNLTKPFDVGFIDDMIETTKFLCSEIQGAKYGYVQSDEISILVTDYDTFETSAWFGYELQKLTSVTASMATAKFNELRSTRFENQSGGFMRPPKLAFFDSRAFNIPKEEVANYFHARLRDAIKNSISMLAQDLFSAKELEYKNGADKLAMCLEKGHDWNNIPFNQQRGTLVRKNTYWNDEIVYSQRVFDQFDEWFEERTDNIVKNVDGGFLNSKGEPIDCKIRTKWEAVRAPEKFTTKNFGETLK